MMSTCSASEMRSPPVRGEERRLADQGNPNARLLVEERRKRGVTISLPAGKPEGAM